MFGEFLGEAGGSRSLWAGAPGCLQTAALLMGVTQTNKLHSQDSFRLSEQAAADME